MPEDKLTRRTFLAQSAGVALGGALAGNQAARATEQRPALPGTVIAGVEVPRLLIGINSLLGWSHTSAGRDAWIRKHFTVDRIAEVFARCIELGVTGVLGPVYDRLIAAIDRTEELTGVRLTYVATTFGSPDTTAEQVRQLRDAGAPICLIHGGWTDQWPVEDGRLKGFEGQLEIIREAGLIPGAACHNGDRLRMVDQGGYDVEMFIIPVNRMGFMMHPSRDVVLAAVRGCSKPVVAIKPLASGRFDEGGIEQWLSWTYSVPNVVGAAIGFMSVEEAEEDIAIASRVLRAV